MKQDTIAAIATALSPSGISIIRISGEDAIEVADRIFLSKNGTSHICDMESHTVKYGFIMDEDKIVDEVLVILMKGPRSYTAEDTVEIDCHGGVVVTKKILNLVVRAGARLAEPGEFTKRAFLNGRIDLSSAEAVADLIDAKNEYAAKSSIEQVRGSVLRKINELREKVLHETAFIEAALDDPEHYSLDGYGIELLPKLRSLIDLLEGMISRSHDGRLLKEGIRTVILGKPNVGKSSLLNLLSGREKAIVTDIAGTTRDIIEEEVNLNGITLTMIDTAGIRDSEDLVEQIGVDRAKEISKAADLILYVVDSSIPLDENDRNIMELIRDRNAIVLLNKSDLAAVISEEELSSKVSHPVISISATMETGLDDLKQTIEKMFFEGNLTFNDEVVITNMRQQQQLRVAKESLELSVRGLEAQVPEDLISIDLMNAYDALGQIIGETVDEDLIDKIFEDFCMGK